MKRLILIVLVLGSSAVVSFGRKETKKVQIRPPVDLEYVDKFNNSLDSLNKIIHEKH